MLLAGLAYSAFGVASVRAAGLPQATTFGVEVSTYATNGVVGPTDLAAASAAGLGVARDGVFTGTQADSVVKLLAQAHLRLYPVLGVPCSSCSDQTSPSADVATSEMEQIITAWAQRYGPGGTFWKQNPTLTYLPIEDFEIGNEPNLPNKWVVDTSHLHWSDDPTSYAQVYEGARAALHQVDPSGTAVVGGLADSAKLGVDVQHDEQWLAALTPGQVDAVGYHDWVYDVSDSLLKTDTEDLRVWMDDNGFASVPLHVNEFGACDQNQDGQCPPTISQTSAQWGAVAADYVNWAACTSWLNIDNIQPFWWGATPSTDQNPFMALVSSNGTVTPYGQAYLAQVTALTTAGCASTAPAGTGPANTSPPTVSGTASVGSQLSGTAGGWTGQPAPTYAYQWEQCDTSGNNCSSVGGATAADYVVQPDDVGSRLVLSVTAVNSVNGATSASEPTAVVTAVPLATTPGVPTAPPGTAKKTSKARLAAMDLRVMRVVRSGLTLKIMVRMHSKAGRVVVTATRVGKRRLLRRLRLRDTKRGTMTFAIKLSAGRWSIAVIGRPAAGFAKPKQISRRLTVPPQRKVKRRSHRGR